MSFRYKFVLLHCLFILLLCGCTTQEDKIKVNKERGDKIAQALEEYKEIHGDFPEHLENLKPDHLSEIPLTIDGDKFRYGLLDGELRFFLSFYIRAIPTCTYDHRLGFWDCSQGIDH